MKILIADDDHDLLELVGFALSQAGFISIKAADGKAALDAFERFLLAESAGLQFALAIDRLLRPVMHVAKMKSVLALDARPLFVVPLHSSPRFGSTPFRVLPR